LHGRKLYKIKGALKRTSSVFAAAAFKLGRSFKHFGHQAPPTYTSISGGTAQQQDIGYLRYLDQNTPPAFSVTPGLLKVDPPIGYLELAVDGEVQDLAAGSRLVVQSRFLQMQGGTPAGPEAPLLATIVRIKQRSMTWGAATGKATIATVNAYMWFIEPGHYYHLLDVREAQIHEVVSPVLRLRGGLAETAETSGTRLYFYGTDAQVQTLDQR